MFEELAAGIFLGISLGVGGSFYAIFRKGYVQAMVFEGIRSYSDGLIEQITKNPEILRPYVEILVRQVQDPKIIQAIIGPFMKEIFKNAPIAPNGEGGIDLKAVPKEWRWIAELGLQFFGPRINEFLGAGGAKTAGTDLLGLPLKT